MKKIFLKLIKLYQDLISPFLPHRCRFYPSCSQYCLLAVKKYGPGKGLLMGTKRILKCNPLTAGGIDLP